MDSLLAIIIRVSIMYLYTLAVMRLSGKRSIDHLSPQDFIVSVIIGDMFDDVFWAEVPIWQGIIGITTIIVVHILVSFVVYKKWAIARLFEPPPTLVIEAGQLIRSGLKKEHIREDSLGSDLRQKGDDSLEEIERGFIEENGQLSLKKYQSMKPAQKQDLEKS